MYRTELACSLVLVIACTQMLRAASLPVPAAMSDGLSRAKRSTHHREDTRLTLILNGNMDDDVTNTEAVSGRARRAADLAYSVATRRRLRRSLGARQAETGRQETEGRLTETDGERLSASARRRRSTATFWLQASIQLCNKHPHMCKRIVVVDGDVHMNIRLMDE